MYNMYPTQDNNQKIVMVTIKSNDVEEAPCFTSVQFLYRNNQSIVDIVKLREREGQRVDLGRSLKGHL